MAQAQKLLVVEIENHAQTFGATDYVVVIAETTDKKQLPVAISHNSLRKSGISDGVFDSLVGSHIIVKDDTNIQTGEFTEAAFRIQQVLDKVPNRSILLCNGANSSFAKSEFLYAEMKDISSSIAAKALVEKDKARRLENARRRAERMSVIQAPLVATASPVLETNDEESPF